MFGDVLYESKQRLYPVALFWSQGGLQPRSCFVVFCQQLLLELVDFAIKTSAKLGIVFDLLLSEDPCCGKPVRLREHSACQLN